MLHGFELSEEMLEVSEMLDPSMLHAFELSDPEHRSCGDDPEHRSCGAQGARGSCGNVDPLDFEESDAGHDNASTIHGGVVSCVSVLTHISGDSKTCAHPGQVTCADVEKEVWEVPEMQQDASEAAVAVADAGGPDAAVAVAGNIGFTFGNWGKKSKNQDFQDNVDLQIKRSLAAILGLIEAQNYHAEILRAPATKGDPRANTKLLQRDSYKWLVVRGIAAEAPFIVVRDSVAANIDLVYQENKFDGRYRAKSGNKCDAYTNIYVATAT